MSEVDAADPGVEVAPGVRKRRVLNAHRPVVEGTAAAENISQVGREGARGGSGCTGDRGCWFSACGTPGVT